MPRARQDASTPAIEASGEAPSATALREAALLHLSRFAASERGLLRVLERRITRWAAQASAAGLAADALSEQRDLASGRAQAVVAELARRGAVDDPAFARNRARSLTQAGRSRRAVAAHLAARGIDGETIRAALDESQPEDGHEQLTAALVQARRRRIGPFAPAQDSTSAQDSASAQESASARQRGLAILARAGFSQQVAAAALDTDHDSAELLIAKLRAGL